MRRAPPGCSCSRSRSRGAGVPPTGMTVTAAAACSRRRVCTASSWAPLRRSLPHVRFGDDGDG
uniref:Uncharacterized protein n=1 Tax=Arundo donax TaxID=35708 RepID=A0A0A8Z5Z9_ARUDO